LGRKVLIAMSGGVDSSVAALQLIENGYHPIGVTLRMWRPGRDKHLEDAVRKSKEICKRLNIPHKVVDVRSDFEKSIVQDFVNGYLSGVTPNPCVYCNKQIKWEKLIDLADKMDVEFIATGHYARVFHNENSHRYEILEGIDHSKDQSYALWQLSQDNLRKTMLPLGNVRKSEVFEIAKKNGLFYSDLSESQDICFIPNNNYRDFLVDYVPERIHKIGRGELVDEEGSVLGFHNGFYNFTIGQRKGFKMGFGGRRYVKEIDAKNNRIVISKEEGLYSMEMVLNKINWVSIPSVSSLKGIVKIRYNHPGIKCYVETYRSDTLKVTFDEPQRAVTPGQSAVLYQGDKLIFGGIITTEK